MWQLLSVSDTTEGPLHLTWHGPQPTSTLDLVRLFKLAPREQENYDGGQETKITNVER